MVIFKKLSFRIVLLTSFVLMAFPLILTGCGLSDAERKARQEQEKHQQEVLDAPRKKLEAEKQAMKQSLMAQIDKYVSLPTVTKKGEAYLRGKIVIVEVVGREISGAYDALPDYI